MRFYTFYIVVVFIIIFGCNKISEQKLEVKDQISESITAKDIDSLRFDDYSLGLDSDKALENWQKYQELNEQIDFLKKADFSFFNGEKSILKSFINDFKVEMPEVIKTTPILSRTTALETKLLKLNSILNLDNMDRATRLTAIKEFLVAMSNLNLQINKKFELEANIVQKNLNIM